MTDEKNNIPDTTTNPAQAGQDQVAPENAAPNGHESADPSAPEIEQHSSSQQAEDQVAQSGQADSDKADSGKADSPQPESGQADSGREEIAKGDESDSENEVVDFDDLEDEFDEDFVDDDDEDEDAAPLETLVEETSKSDDLDMRWYILKVQVNRENSICDALRRRVAVAGLEHYFQDILVPTEDVREFSKAGKQKIVKRKLYPGYVVVRMAINDESWFLVRETPGIGDFTGAAGQPVALTDDEIDRILKTTLPQETEKAEENVKIGIKYKVGDRVRVKEGNFQNYEGDVSNIDERNGRVTVMINIFNRPNPVELDHWQVEEFE